MEPDFSDAATLPKEEDKIKWEFLGKHSVEIKSFGKAFNNFKCPICRSDLTLYRRKSLLKTKCNKCAWQNVSKVNDMLKTREEDISKNFGAIFS